MKDYSNQHIYEGRFLPGEPFVLDSKSPHHIFMATFEDDGVDAYFYAVDPRSVNQPIKDARLIYECKNLAPDLRGQMLKVQILWSEDGKKALLLLDQYPHAAIDFNAEKAYCRMGVPLVSMWNQDNFFWEDRLLRLF